MRRVLMAVLLMVGVADFKLFRLIVGIHASSVSGERWLTVLFAKIQKARHPTSRGRAFGVLNGASSTVPTCAGKLCRRNVKLVTYVMFPPKKMAHPAGAGSALIDDFGFTLYVEAAAQIAAADRTKSPEHATTFPRLSRGLLARPIR
jgi:hypothetical protein